jgi:hypothetical protein
MGHTLDEVWARENAVLHSVKDHGPFKESENREYFRRRRPAPLPA